MSYYYKYNFVSPEPLYATIKEELISYFNSGAVDDLLFATWTDKALRRLSKSSYTITETILHIEDFEARLPDNFFSAREAWLCTSVNGYPIQTANSFYSQASSVNTIKVSPVTTDCDCQEPECMPDLIQAVYKTNNQLNMTYRKEYLLSPGNISVKDKCSLECANFGSSAPDSFDIRDNKFVVNFRTGTVYLIFYSQEYDESGFPLVPDNFYIREYVENFIKFKIFEQLSNQITDETFNQIMQKLQMYEQRYWDSLNRAEIEIKKQPAWAKVRAIKKQLNSFNKFGLPEPRWRTNWNRNS